MAGAILGAKPPDCQLWNTRASAVATDHRGNVALDGALRPPDDKKPLRQQGNRGLRNGAKAAWAYMWSIMTWPKPEQLTWVAPSIRRAKS